MFKADPENNSLMQAIKNGIVDGVLIASRMPLSILGRISTACPAVSINNIFGDGSEVPCISCDYFRVGFLAGKYLLEKGHRRVAYVTDSLKHPETNFEFSSFKAAFEMAGINITQHDVLDTKQNMNIFKKRVLDFFVNSSYTACFIKNTYYSLKMISILRNNGIKIPEDLSVIAVGNYYNSQSGIKLTIIDNKLTEMCHAGLKMLQNIITNNNKTEGGLKLLKPEIIDNHSVININS
jgi:DNA-binding LacI/PurR family transcriptional regulator